MPRIIDAYIPELEQEAQTTRRVLERVPEDQLRWKPHEKSMTLGQLAHHVADTPGEIARFIEKDEFDFGVFDGLRQPAAESKAHLMQVFEENLRIARKTLESMDDARALASWKGMRNGQTLMTMPRIGVVRVIMMNHLYHHRGQLSVYLRLLNVPVPSMYGPSADENPFG
jgi:uncharacterized damage-inducible protein DinB